MTKTVTLSTYLLARVAEEETTASLVLLSSVDTSTGVPEIKYQGIRAWVLAECEAKRRIVELHAGEHECIRADGDLGLNDDEWPCQTLLALAPVYADRADYLEEWRV